MEKVLVEIFVPALNFSFDVFIPKQLYMYEVLELLKKAVIEISDGRYTADKDTVICYRENGSILNINLSVLDLDIKNGSKLMLI